MQHLTDLYLAVAKHVRHPVCVALGPPWPVANLVKAIGHAGVTCWQFDLHQADRLRECLAEVGAAAEVAVLPDLWDLPAAFDTVLFPAAAHADRELKIDVVEQAYHVLRPEGVLISLSEHEKENQFRTWHKNVFGKASQSNASETGVAVWSTRKPAETDKKRRRHETTFHARTGDGPAMTFVTRPGTFSYGRLDDGSRAMLEVAEIAPGHAVLDLGCGNGAVGCLAWPKCGPAGSVTFIDSNVRALGLAETNAAANGVGNARFVAATRLQGLAPGTFDVILANPPYYAKSEITRLFVEGARDLLKPGGRYHIVTKMPTAVVPMIFETFGDCSVIENRGYSVVLAEV
jgi:16S rRNA (guanine1207-N2)-methyltransferase